MFMLTNDQRECFGLKKIPKHLECLQLPKNANDNFETYVYIDNNVIVKCIMSGESYYYEYELSEKVSPDKKYLLPKTEKGKPVILSTSTLSKRTGIGMSLYYGYKNISLYNDKLNSCYYSNAYLNETVHNINQFSEWVEKWCNETTDADKQEFSLLSQQKRRHIKYNEGDVFRFKIGRRQYGYGRILLDYDKMRKLNEPFWDILMSKPLVCSVYHIVTDRDDVSLDELHHLGSLPSTIIADNSLFYGEYKIIGNLPVTENEDYPVMYGNSIHMGEKAVCYQCGKNFRKIDNETAICGGFVNNGVSFDLNFTLDILQQCVVEGSNNPYWSHYYPHWVDRDLRNPKHAEKLQAVKEQFGL